MPSVQYTSDRILLDSLFAEKLVLKLSLTWLPSQKFCSLPSFLLDDKKENDHSPWLRPLQTGIALHKSGFLFSSVALGSDCSFDEERCLSTYYSSRGQGWEVGTSEYITTQRPLWGHGPDPGKSFELFHCLPKNSS